MSLFWSAGTELSTGIKRRQHHWGEAFALLGHWSCVVRAEKLEVIMKRLELLRIIEDLLYESISSGSGHKSCSLGRPKLYPMLEARLGNMQESPRWYWFWRYELVIESNWGFALCGRASVHWGHWWMYIRTWSRRPELRLGTGDRVIVPEQSSEEAIGESMAQMQRSCQHFGDNVIRQ